MASSEDIWIKPLRSRRNDITKTQPCCWVLVFNMVASNDVRVLDSFQETNFIIKTYTLQAETSVGG